MTFSLDLFSDFHKDVYGTRPGRNHPFYTTMTDAERSEHWAYMQAKLIEDEQQRAEDQKLSIELFERNIPKGQRDFTVRQLIETEGMGDPDYLCFLRGLPYGYFKNFAPERTT
jgi:hypothetical protein